MNLSHKAECEWAATGAIEDIVNSKEKDHVPIAKVDVISIETFSSDSVPGSEIVKQDEEVIVYAMYVKWRERQGLLPDFMLDLPVAWSFEITIVSRLVN